MPTQDPARFTTSLLHHAADPFRLLVESVKDYAIYLLDPEGRIASWNTGAERMKGYTADEVLGQPFSRLFSDEEVAAGKPQRDMNAALVQGNIEQEGLRTRKDGSTFCAIYTITALYDAELHLGFSVIVRDVSERKRLEQERSLGERRLRLALHAGNMGMWQWDVVTNVSYWNEKEYELLGLPPGNGTVKADLFFQHVHPDDVPGLRQSLSHALEHGTAFEDEFRIVRADGDTRWLIGRGQLIQDESGHTLRMMGINFDITQRKEAEERVEASERRFRALVEHSWDGVALLNEECRIIYSSPANELVVGYSTDEMVGRIGFDMIHPDDLAASTRLFQQVLEHPGMPFKSQHRMRHKDGSWRWVKFTATNRLDDPSLRAVVVNYRDITEATETEEVRRKAEEATAKLLAIIEGTEDAIIGEDRDGSIVGWNPAAERLYGYRAEEVMGRNICFLIPPECIEEMLALQERVWQGERLPPFETVRKKCDGALIDVTVSLSPVRDRDGRVVAISKIAHDITDRKRAEKQLRLRDRAVQAVSSGILITDPNHLDNPIIFANPAFERMTGYAAEEVVGKNCRFLQGKDTDRSVIAQMRMAVAAGERCDVELLNYRKDGTPFWNHLSISPVHDTAGRLTHFIGVQTDVTDRRKLEMQFRQAQKMEAVGRLAGGVAHDFNNLLTIINGYTEILVEQLPANSPMREMLGEVRKAGERAGSLTKQLLVFSRQSVLEPKVLDINSVVADTEKMLRRLIGEDIHLTTALVHGLPPVKADPGQLQQALINLAVNARDAMPHGGSLTVETHDVELTEEQCSSIAECRPGRYSMLAVTDTGIGMDESTRARIFEPFFTTKEPGKGTGLGLAMVYGFVTSSGGHISVYSEPGHGTAFKVYFPQVQGRVSSGKSWSGVAEMPGGNETVLLVEDDDAVRALTSHVLESGGYTVLAASNGNEALRLAEDHQEPIHLLVTDVVMPFMGGRQVAERIQEIKPGIKVLYCSGYTDDAVVRHGILETGVAFMQKPCSPALLAQKVRDVLDGRES